MTKTSKSGVVKDKSHQNRNLDDHVNETFETIGASEKWTGQEVEVQSDPLIDNQNSGKTIVLRSFFFKANPETMKRDRPTKQQIFDSHIKQIELMLWSDGLTPFKGVEPRIKVSKKRDEYKVVLACEAKASVNFSHTPTKLQDLISKHG